MLGKIQPAFFPHVFGPRGDAAARRRRGARAVRASSPREIRAATGRDLTPEQVAEGFIDIAVGNMANAIKRISVQRGHDVTRYTLVRVRRRRRAARLPGRRRARHDAGLRPPARRRAVRLRHGPRGPDGDARGVGRAPSRGRRDGRARRDARRGSAPTRVQDLRSQGVAPDRIRVVRRVHLRYEGTDTALIVAAGDARGDAGARSTRSTASATRS